MGGGDLNSKKSWHPNTMKNQERVWKAEQAAAQEQKRIMELQSERERERDRAEVKDLVNSLGGSSSDNRLHWMYDKPDKKAQDEDYLLGKAIEKNYDQPEKSDDAIPAVARRVVGTSMSNTSLDVQVDLARKLREDPLLLVKERERAARAALLNNPLHRKRLTELLRKEQEQKKENKRKGDSDLDVKLAAKLSALGKKGISVTDLLNSDGSRSELDSADEYSRKNKRNKKDKKKIPKKPRKRRHSYDSDASDEVGSRRYKRTKYQKKERRGSDVEDPKSNDTDQGQNREQERDRERDREIEKKKNKDNDSKVSEQRFRSENEQKFLNESKQEVKENENIGTRHSGQELNIETKEDTRNVSNNIAKDNVGKYNKHLKYELHDVNEENSYASKAPNQQQDVEGKGNIKYDSPNDSDYDKRVKQKNNKKPKEKKSKRTEFKKRRNQDMAKTITDYKKERRKMNRRYKPRKGECVDSESDDYYDKKHHKQKKEQPSKKLGRKRRSESTDSYITIKHKRPKRNVPSEESCEHCGHAGVHHYGTYQHRHHHHHNHDPERRRSASLTKNDRFARKKHQKRSNLKRDYRKGDLSEDEKAARLAEMLSAGAEREADRAARVAEQRAAPPPPAPAAPASRSDTRSLPESLESRIHSTRHYIQRSSNHMNEPFARR